jgi:glutathione S-transferase
MTLEYYYFPHSQWSRITSLALAELDLRFEPRLVDIRVNANFEPEYLQLNPKGVVPTLVHDGVAICNAMRIAAYADQLALRGGRDPGRALIREDEPRRWQDALASIDVMLLSYSVWIQGQRGERSADILDDKVERGRRYAERHPEFAALYERKRRFFVEFRDAVMDPRRVQDATDHAEATLSELESWLEGGPSFIGGDTVALPDLMATAILWRLADLDVAASWRARDGALAQYERRLRDRPSFSRVFFQDPFLPQDPGSAP